MLKEDNLVKAASAVGIDLISKLNSDNAKMRPEDIIESKIRKLIAENSHLKSADEKIALLKSKKYGWIVEFSKETEEKIHIFINSTAGPELDFWFYW